MVKAGLFEPLGHPSHCISTCTWSPENSTVRKDKARLLRNQSTMLAAVANHTERVRSAFNKRTYTFPHSLSGARLRVCQSMVKTPPYVAAFFRRVSQGFHAPLSSRPKRRGANSAVSCI